MSTKVLLPTNILTFSANSEQELDRKIERCKNYLKNGDTSSTPGDISNIAFTGNIQGPHLPHRAAVVGKTSSEILAKLEKLSFERGEVKGPLPKLCFMFTGHGQSYHKMGQELYNTSAVYKRIFDDLDKLYARLDMPIKEVIYGEDESLLNEAININPAVCVLQNCLRGMWEAWGIAPDCILGHSIGELSAAAAAGSLPSDTILEGSRKFFAQGIPVGKMVALTTDKKIAETLIERFASTNSESGKDLWLEVAVTNTRTQTVVAGTPESIPMFVKLCENNGVKAYILPLDTAYHSRGMEPGVEAYRKSICSMDRIKPKCPYISSITGGLIEGEIDAEYWVRHIRHCCRFYEASQVAYGMGARVFLEIGAQPILSALIMQNVEEIENAEMITCIPSMRKNAKGGDWACMTNALAKLYVLGYPVNWDGFYQDFDVQTVELPFAVKNRNEISELDGHQVKLSPECFWEDLNNNGTDDAKRYIIHSYLLEVLKLVLEEVEVDFDEIDVKQDFRDMGVTSLMAIQMELHIQKLLTSKVVLSFTDLIDCHTLDQLVTKIYNLIYSSTKDEPMVKLNELKDLVKADSVLWDHIQVQPGSPSPVPLSKIKTILLTGSTGNLAPYLLELLTIRPESEKVYCIVRDGRNESAEHRLHNHLKKMKLWDRVDMSKVVVIKGNISDQFLGMEKEAYKKLADTVEAIIHSAVASNHLVQYKKEDLRYGGVRAVNVIGTQRIFEFAANTRAKHVFHASTMLALWAKDDLEYDKVPEEWPGDFWKDLSKMPTSFGYSISKHISDCLAHQAIQRGIPCKSFRFPKINGDTKSGRQQVMQNHFFVKFLYYIIAGVMPDLDIALQLLPVDTCADLSLRVFFNEQAPSDIYNVLNPHDLKEVDIAVLVEEFGPQLRILEQVGRVVEKEGEEAAKEKWRQMTSSGPLLKLASELDNEVLAENPSAAFSNEKVKKFIQAEFGYSMKTVEYNEFVKKLVEDGENSLLFNWIEFYTKDDSVFRIFADGMYPLQKHWEKDPAGFISGSKIELLYPNLKDIVESPMETLRRDITFVIENAREIFSKKHV